MPTTQRVFSRIHQWRQAQCSTAHEVQVFTQIIFPARAQREGTFFFKSAEPGRTVLRFQTVDAWIDKEFVVLVQEPGDLTSYKEPGDLTETLFL